MASSRRSKPLPKEPEIGAPGWRRAMLKWLSDDRTNPPIVLGKIRPPVHLSDGARLAWLRIGPRADAALAARGSSCRRSCLPCFTDLCSAVARVEAGDRKAWSTVHLFGELYFLDPRSLPARRKR